MQFSYVNPTQIQFGQGQIQSIQSIILPIKKYLLFTVVVQLKEMVFMIRLRRL